MDHFRQDLHLRRPAPVQGARFHPVAVVTLCAWHRRQQRHLQRGQRRAAEAAAVPGVRAARRRVPRDRRAAGVMSGPNFSESRGSRPRSRTRPRFRRRRMVLTGEGEPERLAVARGERIAVQRPARAPGNRAGVQCGREHARAGRTSSSSRHGLWQQRFGGDRASSAGGSCSTACRAKWSASCREGSRIRRIARRGCRSSTTRAWSARSAAPGTSASSRD